MRCIAALFTLQPRPSTDHHFACPDISYYQAALMQNKEDARAIATAMMEVASCTGDVPPPGLEEQMRNQTRLPTALELKCPCRCIQAFFQLGVRDSRFALEVLTNVVPPLVRFIRNEEYRTDLARISGAPRTPVRTKPS